MLDNKNLLSSDTSLGKICKYTLRDLNCEYTRTWIESSHIQTGLQVITMHLEIRVEDAPRNTP